MPSTDDLLAAARRWAHRSLDPSIGQPHLPPDIIHLFETATEAQRSQAISSLLQESEARLNATPHEAAALARAAYEGTRGRTSTPHLAETALALAIALNRLGDFAEAPRLADEAAAHFEHCGEMEQAAHSLCQAAWAETLAGDLRSATTNVKRARATSRSPLLQAQCDWTEARILEHQERNEDAKSFLEKARADLLGLERPLDAARCERELVYVYLLGKLSARAPVLERVRRTFEAAGCVLDVAQCDHLQASILMHAGRYELATELLLNARHRFESLKGGFFVAWCDLTRGVVYRRLGRFEESLQASHQARDYFLSHGVRLLVPVCDINLGSTYYVLNRYDEALSHYRQASDASLSEGREERAARLFINMGMVYVKQGLYSQALDLYNRALEIGISKSLRFLIFGSHTCLAACLRELGQFAEALDHLQSAEMAMSESPLNETRIQLKIDSAQLHLALRHTSEAITSLEQARQGAKEHGHDSLIAVCDHLLAQATLETGDRARVLELIEHARELFLKHDQIVDAALCDLTEGEVHLQSNHAAAAQTYFENAQPVLSPSFPDQAWRVDHGLARCADIYDRPLEALNYYRRAVHTIAAARSALVTEQFSNDFFAGRQSIYSEALSLAFRQDAREAALEIIEASKARTFLTLLQQRGWQVRDDCTDPYVANLVAREKSLRYALETLRGRLAVRYSKEPEDILRSGTELPATISAAFHEMNALNQAYEAVVTQLRLATTGLAGVAVPLPFDLEKFRAAANTTWGLDWTAVDYYLAGDTLTMMVLGPDHLQMMQRRLTAFDAALLEKCTRTEPDMRELIYRGTLRGEATPSSGARYLEHLYHLLIPPKLTATTLIIAPNGTMHTLPFQALTDGGTFLVERHTIVYTPSLQVLQHLLGQPSRAAVAHSLVMGVSEFTGRAPKLPFASAEVERLRYIFGDGQFWQDKDATRRRIFDLSLSKELEKFDLVHLATHAILDRKAPHQSRVILYDEALTVLDIVALSVNARLVTLSACQSALGQGGQGDEWVGLARAFFYAGAQALLVTQWPVEDSAMVELTECFYRHWTSGMDAASSLRQAQIEMIRSGRVPYQWASFVLMGRP